MALSTGDRLGPYRLVAPIGKGGMGSVWRAVRESGDFEQEVAIKFVHRNLATDVVERFRRERQILAQLNHPNISRILDGGSFDDLPYLVMEFIDGRPLVAYAEENKLSLRERIVLFRQVCEAVQYAHQRLIVHRDLKPANILVAKDGTPKLLDFGIAKILAEGIPGDAPTQTATGVVMMTPDYASPEQVRGDPVSTASDIYSLGAVLYELLTSERPHGLTTYTAAELVQKICETATVAPSKRGHPALRGDLDTIVLRAMHKDPARRYVSADQLSEDLHRYLTGLPVLARPDTLRYRISKYAQRNKWGLAAVAAVLLALLAGWIAAERQARIAAERFEMVRGLANRFVFEIHDEIAQVDGTVKARQLLVATGLQYLDKLAASAGNDPALLEDLSKAYARIGDVQGRAGTPNLGQREAASQSYQKAVDLAERLYRKDPVKYAYALAVAHSNMAQILYSRELDDESQEHLERSTELAREGEKRDPKDQKVQELLAGNTNQLGTLYYGKLQMREALREYDASEQLWEQIAARDPSQKNRLSASAAAGTLARLKQFFGELESARGLLERSRQTIEEEVARNPGDPRILRRASLHYQMLNGVYLSETRPSLDDAEEAWRWRQKSSAITAQLTAKDPDNADARDLRSADDTGSGYILALLGRAKEAAPLLEDGLTLTRALKKASPNVNYWDTRETYALRWLAYSYSQLGRKDAARKAAAEAVALGLRNLSSDPTSAPGQLFLVNCYRMQAYVESVARDFKSALAALEKAGGIANKWPSSPRHELFYAVSLSNYYQSYVELARAEGNARAVREWSDKLQALWQTWPEQNGYTKMRQAHPTVRYPW